MPGAGEAGGPPGASACLPRVHRVGGREPVEALLGSFSAPRPAERAPREGRELRQAGGRAGGRRSPSLAGGEAAEPKFAAVLKAPVVRLRRCRGGAGGGGRADPSLSLRASEGHGRRSGTGFIVPQARPAVAVAAAAVAAAATLNGPPCLAAPLW